MPRPEWCGPAQMGGKRGIEHRDALVGRAVDVDAALAGDEVAASTSSSVAATSSMTAAARSQSDGVADPVGAAAGKVPMQCGPVSVSAVSIITVS